MFDRYTRPTGAGQYAPGRDVPQVDEDPRKRRPQGPDINAAIMGGMPVGGAALPFEGAKQTVLPGGNTGVAGERQLGVQPGMSLEGGIANPMGAPAASPQKSFQTKLMEGDPNKLGNAEHMAKSPKYDFLTLANSGKYNYDQMGDMLKELQGGPNARLWQGWATDGKGNMTFQGDPSQLAPEWNGKKRVDAVGAYGDFANGGQAQGWRWGIDDDAPAGPGVNPSIMQNAILGQGGAAPTTESSSDYTAKLRQQIMQALQVNPQLAQFAREFGY